MKESSPSKRTLPDDDEKCPILDGVVGLKIKEYEKNDVIFYT